MTFKMLVEKVTKEVNAQWHVIKLDDGTELSTNLKMISSGHIQIGKPKERTSTTYKIQENESLVKQIGKLIGQKLDLKDPEVMAFLELYPCPCDVK